MGYRKETQTSMGPFCFGYRSTSFNSTTEYAVIPFSNVVDSRSASITGGLALDPGNLLLYSVGETRAASGDPSGVTTCDMQIYNNVGSKSQGYQIRDNVPGAYLCDDACYGLTRDSQVTLQVAEIYASYNLYSSANETRMMSVVTK